MPRCYKPSLTLEGLKAKLTEFNRYSGTAANFQVDQTQLTHGVPGGPPASITLTNWQGTAVLTIHEESGGWVCNPADSPLKGYLTMMYTVATIGQETIAQYIFQHVSNTDRDGCGDAAVAQGGAGGDPGGVGTSPHSSIWGTPNSAGAATPAAGAAGGGSPPFVFSSTPTPPPSPPTRRRKNSSRKNNRKNNRKNSRKNSRRRHRTKQNRY
jgi:hypothetical protein